MSLSEREKRELLLIAEGLQRDDQELARKLRGPEPKPSEWAVMWQMLGSIAAGLAVAGAGAHWHVGVLVAIGVVFALIGPVLLSIRQSTGHRVRPGQGGAPRWAGRHRRSHARASGGDGLGCPHVPAPRPGGAGPRGDGEGQEL
jgi:hypothetical protein